MLDRKPMKKPDDNGMRKGLMYAVANDYKKKHKIQVMEYIRTHFCRLDELSPDIKKQLAEKHKLSISTINEYIREIIEIQDRLKKQFEQYPINPQLITFESQKESTLPFAKVKEYGLDLKSYDGKNLPKGKVVLRLDFKLAVKGKDAIELFFTALNDGKKYKLTQWQNNGKFAPYKSVVDFGKPFSNGLFYYVEFELNQKGYTQIKSVTFI